MVYSANRPETHGVYRDWRAIAESYAPPRLLLGETWVAELAGMAAFHGRGDELQLTFNFPLIFASFTAEALAGVVAGTLAALPAGECPVSTGPITTSAGSRPGGVAAMRPGPGSPCWCSRPCRARSSCITGTRSR